MNRIIDYKIKGLSFEVRWELWKRLDNINRAMVKHLLEKPQGYTTFRSYGLTNKYKWKWNAILNASSM